MVAAITAIGCIFLTAQRIIAGGFDPFNPTAKNAQSTPSATQSPYILTQAAVTIDAPDDRTIIHPTQIGIAVADAVSYQTAKSATPLRFLVTLTQASKSVVTVNYATSNINADQDFKSTNGVLMFPKGTTSQYIDVTVYGENTPEGKEYISLHLFDAVGAKIVNAHAVGTIINEVDSGLPRVSLVGDVVGVATKTVWVRVQLSEKSSKTVTVNFQTHKLAGVKTDFVGPSNIKLTFKPGVTQQFVEFQLLGDVTPEAGQKIELFSDSISDAVNAVVDENLGTAGCYVIQ
jgi:hypothetical protein